jgi:hypothetical protein
MEKGHSRVPIYHESPQNVIGVVLVKTLVPYDPDEAVPLSSLKIRRLPRVQASTPLFEILHIFEEGGSHMALVVEEVGLEESLSLPQITILDSPLWVSGHLEKGPHKIKYKAIGIVTMEDVIEELLGEEIIDETDVYVDMNTKIEVSRRPLSAIPRVLSTLAIVPSPLSVHPSPRLAPAEEERVPLLTPLENSLNASGNNGAGSTSEAILTPRLRPRGAKRRKTKELIEASKLATDVSPNDRPVRPSSLLFRSGSSLAPTVSAGSPQHRRDDLNDTDTYIRIIAEEDGFVIDGQPQILEWSLDGEPLAGGGSSGL